MLELEKTYLAKSLPEGLEKSQSMEIIDIYIPKDSEHCKLRMRKKWSKYTMTKKAPIDASDVSVQMENNIELEENEFDALSKIEGKRVRKIRYNYLYDWKICEIDVFQDLLEWLVLVDVEFESEIEKNSFVMPDFCLADVTQDDFIAWGVLAGKCYDDLIERLWKYCYEKISL